MARHADDRAMVVEKIAPLLVARTLTPFDLIVIFVGIVLFITNSAGIQFAGPSAFVFWIVGFVLFLMTGAFITAHLGRMFPEEGSLFVWTHKVMGPFWGFFAGFVAWWPGPLVMAAAGILVVAFTQQIGTFLGHGILTESWQQGLVVLAVLWLGAALSLLRMRLTQNYVNLQFYFYGAAIFLMGLAGVIWLLRGNSSANSFAAELWNPFQGDKLVLGLPGYLTWYSFAVLALLGIEVPLNMGVEVTGGEQAIRKYLFWGCGIVIAAYLWTTWGNMVTVPVGVLNGTTGGAQGVGVAMGEFFGILVALILLWFFVTASMVYNYSFARLLFVSGLEKRLPPAIGRVNKNKVPANAVILQTVVSTIITVVIFFIIAGAGGDPNKPYFALLAGLTIIWCISTALLFADIFFARRADPVRFEQARRVNTGFLYVCGVVGFVANLAAVFFIFVGSWYPPGFPTLGEWNTWMAIISIVSIIGGIVIWFISQAMRGGKTDTELVAEVAAEVGVSGLVNPGPMA